MSVSKTGKALGHEVWKDLLKKRMDGGTDDDAYKILDRVMGDAEAWGEIQRLANKKKEFLKRMRTLTSEQDTLKRNIEETIDNMKAWQAKKFEEMKASMEQQSAIAKGFADLLANIRETAAYCNERYISSSAHATKLDHEGQAALGASICERTV